MPERLRALGEALDDSFNSVIQVPILKEIVVGMDRFRF